MARAVQVSILTDGALAGEAFSPTESMAGRRVERRVEPLDEPDLVGASRFVVGRFSTDR